MLVKRTNLPPKQAELRNKILDAAIETFIEYGFYKTGMLDISKRIDIAVGTIYTYFINKDDLILEAINKIVGTILTEAQIRIKYITNPLEKIVTFLSANLEVLYKRKDWGKLLAFEMYVVPQNLLMSPDHSIFATYVHKLEELIKEAIAKGYIKEQNTRLMALHCLGSIDFLNRSWVVYDYKIDFKKDKEQV